MQLSLNLAAYPNPLLMEPNKMYYLTFASILREYQLKQNEKENDEIEHLEF